MDFLDLAKKRYSVRSFQQKPVEEEKLALILEAAHVAPTAANRQPQKIYVLNSPDALAKISDAARTYGAPLVMVICSDKEQVWTRKHDGRQTLDIDASIITDHMMLEATDLGLGTLWICWYQEELLRQALEIPTHLEIVNLLAIGYADCPPADENRHAELRKPLSETVVRL